MVGTIFKTFVFFFICFIVLCIPIKDRTLFEHLFRVSRPVGKIITEGAETGLQKTQTYGKKLFSNSDPAIITRDEVRSVNSSAKKVTKKSLDHYSEDDEKALNQAIENN